MKMTREERILKKMPAEERMLLQKKVDQILEKSRDLYTKFNEIIQKEDPDFATLSYTLMCMLAIIAGEENMKKQKILETLGEIFESMQNRFEECKKS